MNELQDKAIKAALNGDWEQAVELNLEILSGSPDNLACLKRLGRAYTELGQKEAASDAYQQVLKIDKYDSVASKNLKLLPHQKFNSHTILTVDENFIELPGLTKSIMLIKVASRDILLGLTCKQCLDLVPRSRLVSVLTQDKTCIGYLPDDLSLRIKSFLKSGYLYTTCLKGASDNTATIFIREIKRPKKPSANPTFSRSAIIAKSK